MIGEVLKDRIRIEDSANDWKEAIAMAIRPLQDTGCAEERYLDAIYQNVKENGDYFILMPGFAMPHSRPEKGALKNGMSFLKLRKPVRFSSGQEITYLLGVTATDSDTHLELLSELAEVLMDEKVLKQLEQADSEEEIREIFQ